MTPIYRALIYFASIAVGAAACALPPESPSDQSVPAAPSQYGDPQDLAFLKDLMNIGPWISVTDYPYETTDDMNEADSLADWELENMEARGALCWALFDDFGAGNVSFYRPFAVVEIDATLFDLASRHPLIEHQLGKDCADIGLGSLAKGKDLSPGTLLAIAPFEVYLVDENNDTSPDYLRLLVRQAARLDDVLAYLGLAPNAYRSFGEEEGVGQSVAKLIPEGQSLVGLPASFGYLAEINLETCAYDKERFINSSYGGSDEELEPLRGTVYELLLPTGTLLRLVSHRGYDYLVEFSAWKFKEQDWITGIFDADDLWARQIQCSIGWNANR